MWVETTQGASHLAHGQVGSLKAMMGADGRVARLIESGSFGNVVSDSNPLLDVAHGFAGGLADSDTGLVLFAAKSGSTRSSDTTASPMMMNSRSTAERITRSER